MKRLLLILILTFNFQSMTKADDIRDVEIEGMSIGNSLLDFFNKNEIIENIRKDSYEGFDDKFIDIILSSSTFKNYQALQITVKRSDKKYIIHSIDGALFFKRDDLACINKLDIITKDLSKSFKNVKFNIVDEKIHQQDPTKKSTYQGSDAYLDNGNISIFCYLWSEDMPYDNYLAVSIRTEEFQNWLLAYQENLEQDS